MRTVTFNVDEKDYTVKFDYNAISDMEKLVGEPILVYLDRGYMDSLRVLLWGGLKWKIQGLTIQYAGNLVQKLASEKKLKKTVTDVSECLQYAIRELDEEVNEEQTEGE